ncbi:MAG TPA: amidohydrolase family protein [Gaiellaceae bacterium]|nr:amidohydrolase family protein [Gaiellaceae bacterium]
MAAKRAIVSAFGIERRSSDQDTAEQYAASAARRPGAPVRAPASVARVAGTLRLPGFVNAHSHTFQRAMRGSAAGGDFWAWRETMLAEADRQTPELVRAEYERTYREMLAAGYTAVGEFHYLGVAEAHAATEAAAAAGISIVVLHVAYARGGLPRFRQSSVDEFVRQVEDLRAAGIAVGVAPHSVRACPIDWLEEIGRYASSEGLPLHVHADEQPKEIEECLAEHGVRPIEVLSRAGCLGPRTTIVHATHADGAELDLLAQSGAAICACPTTEADLGDGFLPTDRARRRAVPICIGSDSNVRIDPFEELRELEGIARRQTGRRGIFSTDELYAFGRDVGARSLGLEDWPTIEIDLAHSSLAGVDPSHVEAALIAGCGSDVVVATVAR